MVFNTLFLETRNFVKIIYLGLRNSIYCHDAIGASSQASSSFNCGISLFDSESQVRCKNGDTSDGLLESSALLGARRTTKGY